MFSIRLKKIIIKAQKKTKNPQQKNTLRTQPTIELETTKRTQNIPNPTLNPILNHIC